MKTSRRIGAAVAAGGIALVAARAVIAEIEQGMKGPQAAASVTASANSGGTSYALAA